MRTLLPFLFILSACSSPPLPPHVIQYSGKGTLTVTVQRDQANNIFTSWGESLGGIAKQLLPFIGL